MNYYQHHIGDFDKATRHLTRLERSIYRDLIDLYYDTEAPLPLDMKALCRRVIARSNEEVTAVEQVLNEFFNETPDGWYHSRCEEEIERYRASNTQKALAGQASAAARAAKKKQALNVRSTDVQRPSNERATNQEPITNNQEPITNNQDKTPAAPAAAKAALSVADLVGMGVEQQVAADFIAVRKAKKAPLTSTALDGIKREAEKAGITLGRALATCAVRGWGGFNAEWVQQRPAVAQAGMTRLQKVVAVNKPDFDAMERELTGTVAGAPAGDFIDGEVINAR